MISIEYTQIIAQVSCPIPTTAQFAAIVTLILGLGIIGISAGISVISLATTIIALIVSGSPLEAISAAIATHMGAIASSTGVVAALYQGIKNILGC